ncbi:MAG: hypothetical protein WB780_22355 [Candidatus Acidiferrales bacterium]
MQKSRELKLKGLVQAGSKAQKSSTNESSAGKPIAERATEIDFSHLGGKLLHRVEPDSTPKGEINFEDLGGKKVGHFRLNES